MTVTTIQPDAAAGKDTYIVSTDVTANYGTNIGLPLGDYDVANSQSLRCLIAFDISSIPAGDVIDEATLSLYEYDSIGSGDATVYLHRVLKDWVESQATWNIYKTGSNWGTAGCAQDGTDAVATASSSLVVDATTSNAFLDWTGLAADVQGWLDGDFANYGWLLRHSGEFDAASRRYNKFRSSDYTTEALRPKLTITHHTPTGGAPIHLCRTHFIAEGILR